MPAMCWYGGHEVGIVVRRWPLGVCGVVARLCIVSYAMCSYVALPSKCCFDVVDCIVEVDLWLGSCVNYWSLISTARVVAPDGHVVLGRWVGVNIEERGI